MSRSEPEKGLRSIYSINHNAPFLSRIMTTYFLLFNIPLNSSLVSLREKCQREWSSVTTIRHRFGDFPSFLGTEKLFFSRSRLFVTGSLLSRLPVMIRRGMKLSMDKSAYNVHHMYPHSFPCACQINPVWTPGFRNRNRAVWCQSGLPGLQCHRVDYNSLGGTAVLCFNCKALSNFDIPVHQVLSINLHLFCVLPAPGSPSVDLTAR